MKPARLSPSLFFLLMLPLVAQKLDGTLAWPWWSWNPLAGSVFILAVWAIYGVAVVCVFGTIALVVSAIRDGMKAAQEQRKIKRRADELADLERRRMGPQGRRE